MANTGRYVPWARLGLWNCRVHSPTRRWTLLRSPRDMVEGNFTPSSDRARRIRVLTMYFPPGSASRLVTRRGLLMIVECRRRLALRFEAMVSTRPRVADCGLLGGEGDAGGVVDVDGSATYSTNISSSSSSKKEESSSSESSSAPLLLITPYASSSSSLLSGVMDEALDLDAFPVAETLDVSAPFSLKYRSMGSSGSIHSS
mmetsp:Transcript_9019/g.15697  ORF Transcript_9019/g.15697 Transcript_9019/m.15697 type:complete len:201 (-) Transcript_9019:251-853(-)